MLLVSQFSQKKNYKKKNVFKKSFCYFTINKFNGKKIRIIEKKRINFYWNFDNSIRIKGIV
jgi:hypothetical protein